MHPLDSAREHLKRAQENIQNLNRELTDFLAKCPSRVLDVDPNTRTIMITDDDRQAYEKIRDFVLTEQVPLSFRVLAGEVFHHLRASFDHVAWQLSSPEMQAKSPWRIQFPACREEKVCGFNKDKMCPYCRQVEGIASVSALARIHSLQPYISNDPERHPLWIIHHLNRVDKHRELILSPFLMNADLQARTFFRATGVQLPFETRPRNVRIVGPPTGVDMKIKLTVQIALGEPTVESDQKAIIPMLENLRRFAVDSVESFAAEFA